MANSKISALPSLTGAELASGDEIPIVDISVPATKQITVAELKLGVMPSPGPIGGTTPSTGAFTNLTVAGGTTLGDASADNLTTNFGTVTQNANILQTRAIGVAAAGNQNPIDFRTTFYGDASGTSDVRAMINIINGSGTNNIADIRARYTGCELSTSAGTTALAYADHEYIWLKNFGALNIGIVHYAHGRTDAGAISLLRIYEAGSTVINSTGTVGTVIGFLTSNIGHATAVTNAYGVRVTDTSAANLVSGVEIETTSGTGKWALRVSGSANSAFAGKVRIGSNVAPTNTLDITGTAAVTTGFAVGGATPGTGGIAFPATAVAVADANTLDDYEEGTWTPVVTFTGGNGDLTTAEALGTYTKIGRLVTISFNVEFTETTAAANLTITGLPFTSGGIARVPAGCFVDNMTGVSGGVIATIGLVVSTITIGYTGTGGFVNVTNTNTGASTRVRSTLSYTV